jgi:hypothetical protein
VSSLSCAYLEDGRIVRRFRDGVLDVFFALFTPEDRIELRGSDAWRFVKDNYYDDSEESDAVLRGFRVSVRSLRERLDLLGVSVAVVQPTLEQLVSEELERLEGVAGVAEASKRAQFLRDMTWARWTSLVTAGFDAGDDGRRVGGRARPDGVGELLAMWDYIDDRFALRAALECLPSEAFLTIDLLEELEGDGLEPFDPQDYVKGVVHYASLGGVPPVVLTEGRFDAEVLEAALSLRKPHLRGYLRFPDFSHRSEGGAASLRQSIRAFASAGIVNRAVGLFDNDTAARDVLVGVDESLLPAQLRVTQLPDLDLARSYPTVGPQGVNVMNVNGLAGSIELYLGEDVLRTDDGSLRPVVWGGYVRRLSAYQGEVDDKDAIQTAFRTKVATAVADPAAMAEQDWTGLDLVLDHLIELISTMTLDL